MSIDKALKMCGAALVNIIYERGDHHASYQIALFHYLRNAVGSGGTRQSPAKARGIHPQQREAALLDRHEAPSGMQQDYHLGNA